MRMYRVDDGGADHWVIARDEDGAKRLVEKAIKDMGGYGDAYELRCEVVHHEKDVTFCAQSKPITHTAEDWLIIYEGDGERYCACSEF